MASGKSLRTCGLRRLVALEVGQRERPPPPARQLQALAAGVAGEVVLARERRARRASTRGDRSGGSDRACRRRLTPYTASSITAEAHLRAHRRAGVIGHRHRERRPAPRLRHRLVRGDRHVQRALTARARRGAARRDTAGRRAGRRCSRRRRRRRLRRSAPRWRPIAVGRSTWCHDTCWPSLVTSTGPVMLSPRTISRADSPGCVALAIRQQLEDSDRRRPRRWCRCEPGTHSHA